MKVIQPNCRIQFTAEDIDFIVSTLHPKAGDHQCLVKLLTDEETRDLILDNEALFHALLEHRAIVYTRENKPFSEVRELYQRSLLSFTPPR